MLFILFVYFSGGELRTSFPGCLPLPCATCKGPVLSFGGTLLNVLSLGLITSQFTQGLPGDNSSFSACLSQS